MIDLDLFSNSLKDVWQSILGKIGKMTFIWQAGIPKRQGIWQFQFKNILWQYCSYILCKYDQDRSGKPGDCEGNYCMHLFGQDIKYRHIRPNISATTRLIFVSLSA